MERFLTIIALIVIALISVGCATQASGAERGPFGIGVIRSAKDYEGSRDYWLSPRFESETYRQDYLSYQYYRPGLQADYNSHDVLVERSTSDYSGARPRHTYGWSRSVGVGISADASRYSGLADYRQYPRTDGYGHRLSRRERERRR
ncbi:MAG: hypothetical protein Q7S15_02680 [bacterium]|nr:hypothetical protein [bacterium]